ncbi:MAG: murein hydrolase activator EnvC family protein [Bacillota bacterium]|jgi:murein DD-endopeptidase MepM/ murein hydrolase activator NlpD
MRFSKHLKYILVTIIASAIMVAGFGINSSAANPLSDYQKQQKQLQEEMEDQQKAIAEQQKKKKTIQGQVANLDLQINKLEQDAKNADIQLQVAQKQIDLANAELQEAQANLDKRNKALSKRIREIYTTGDISLMDVFFEATSYNDFLVRYDMVQRIMDQDMNLLAQIKADKTKIEENKAFLEERASDLKVLKQSKLDSKKSLENLQKEKRQLLKEAENDIEKAKQYYEEMEAASNAVEAKIRAIQAANSGSSGSSSVAPSGKFTWPIPGYRSVSSPYGNRFHPVLKVYKMHTGVDFPAPAGTPIVAAASGKVINAGWLNGYGNTVIIDHGGGVSTLYGHMSSFAVSDGQSVSAGQKVGGVGTTGYSTGNHLHFEVRINGKHVSPWGYI